MENKLQESVLGGFQSVRWKVKSLGLSRHWQVIASTLSRFDSLSIVSRQSDLDGVGGISALFSPRVYRYVAMILMVLTLGIGNAWGATFIEKWQSGKLENTRSVMANITMGSNATINSSRIEITSGNTGHFTIATITGYTITSVKFFMNSDDNKIATNSFKGTNGTVTNTETKEWTYTPSSTPSSVDFEVQASGGKVQISRVWITFTDGVSESYYESLVPTAVSSGTVTCTSTAATSYASITTSGSLNNQAISFGNNGTMTVTATKNIKYILFSWHKNTPSADNKWVPQNGTMSVSTHKWTPSNSTTKSVTFTRKESNNTEVSNIHIAYYDDVTPSCSTPADPTGLSVGSITGSGATFTITDAANTNNYEIVCKESSTTPASDATPTETGTSQTIAVTGLDGGTTYYAWVRAVCDATHKSSWVALGSTFTTLQAITPNLSYANNPLVLTIRTSGAPTLTGNTGSGTVTWNSSAEGVATVDASGNITAVAAGTTTITASIAANGGYAAGEATAIVRVAAAPTHLIENILATGGTTWDSYVVTSDYSKISNLVALKEAPDMTLIKKATSSTGRTIGITSTSGAKNENEYLYLQFTIADGYALTISDINIPVFSISNNGKYIGRIYDDAATPNVIETEELTVNSATDGIVFKDYDFSSQPSLTGTVTLKLFAYGWGDGYRMKSPVYIDGTITSTTPSSGYVITKSATNGTIAVTDGADAISSADEDDVVYIAATPATGYGFTSWSVFKTGDTETTVSLAADDDDDNTTRKFSMPAYDVTVGATFTAIDYTVTHSAATNGTYTIKVGTADAVSTNTTAQYGQTVTLAASPNPGYGFAGWTVMQGETPVSVTNNAFTMPAGNVTISASFAQEPNVYYYKSASHLDGSTYKNPEGNAHDVALSNPWTIVSGGTIAGVTSVVANGATFDDKSNDTEKWVTSYIKLSKDDASQNITFTIASGYLATIKMKIGAWSNTPTIYLKKGSDVQAYTGTIGGVATTENNFNELTWSNLSAGVYVLNVANEGDKKNAYISQIDIQTTAVYTLTYDANGGTGTMDNTVGTGTVTLRTNTYTKSGCTFQGWATSQDNANAGTVAYADGATNYNLSADATLYAVWKLNAPTISCAANVVTMSAMSGAAIYYTTDGETTPTSSSTLYNSSSKPQIAANTTFKAIAILENYVSSDVTTQACEYVAPATVDDLVTIDADYTFTPSAAMTANTLYESDKIIAIGDGNSYNNGLQIKENRAIAFKVANNAKVKVTFTTNGDREMQLGTATTDDDNKEYGHTKTSPAVFEVSTGGVVYLTASSDLYMTKLEVMYPHTVTYALGDGTGTLPTEGSHYKGDQFDVHDGTTGITAPDGKEFSVWSDGTSTYAGGAQYTMGSSNVTLTAQWITALPLPTITFNNGSYTIAGDALNLSSLFSSNSDGAVTYSVKDANGTGATIDGTSFTATTAGSAVVTASQAATASYKAKSVDATITVSAPSEVEGVKLVQTIGEEVSYTGNFRTTASLSSQARTIAGINYTKYANLSSRSSWGSQPSGPDNYLLQYTLTKKTNKFYFYAYNKNTGTKYIKVYVKEEGENIVTKDIELDGSKGNMFSCDVDVNKNAEVCISHTSTDVQICQVIVVESGADLLTAPDVNYNINFNKGRLTAKSGTAKTFEGITYCNNADYKIDNSTSLKLTTRGTHYISFEIPTGQTRKLQVTAGGGAYNLSKIKGDAEKTTVSGNRNINLGAGIWYLNPQGSDVTVTNLKFVESDAAITVAFNSNGGSDVESQALFAGDVVTEPTAPTKDGYRFVKWQLGGVDYDFATALVADDAPGFTLDAVWQKVWTVTFDSDGGSDVAAATVDNGAAVAKPADPTKVGFDFVEWQLNSAAYNFASAVTANITLVATWQVAQTDASLSALSYNGNAIDVNSAVEVESVQTYTVHLQWGSTVNAALISVTKSAESADMSAIVYNSEDKQATFQVTSGNGTVTVNYAIQFVIDAKRGTSIVKAVVSGGDQNAGFDATGIYGDKGYAYTRNNKKLDTADKFVGVKLLAGNTFAVGDKLFVVTSTAANMGYIELYEEAEGTNLIKATGVRDASAGIEIPSELVGLSEFYIVRKESTGDQAWNGFVDYVEVTREMNPAIKSFKFGDDAATINEAAKTISIDVPYGTDVTALAPTVEAYGNNGATYTPTGAKDFTSPVNYVVTDAYSELSTTYEVSINVAAPSTNAYLASLSVAGYTLNFNKATTEYNVVLDYGTSVLPTISYEVEDTGLAEAEKVEGGVNGATTITVTPQAGAGYEKVYTINFSVSTTPKYVIYDGSRGMTAFSATSFEDEDTHFAWNIGSGITPSADDVPNTSTYNNVWDGKAYTKMLKGFKPQDAATTQLSITVPENYLAKIRLVGTTNSNESMRTMFISQSASRNAEDALNGYIIESNSYNASGFVTDYLFAGTYYIGSTDAMRLYELSVTLYHIDYSRDVTPKTYGTICLPNGGIMVGATIFEVAHMTYENAQPYKVFFDEVIDGVMEAGMPYIFLPKEGVTSIAVTYTDNDNASAGNYHGLYGTMSRIEGDDLLGKYIFYNNSIFASENPQNWLSANRAYIVLNKVPDYVTPVAPGCRRVSMGFNGTNSATGFENIEAPEGRVQKVLIDGKIYILRGEKIFDMTGKLVK